jgi:hypothetical protein
MQKTLCHNCNNYLNNLRCLAFERIPDEIIIGPNDHSEPLSGQGNDIVFEPSDSAVKNLLKLAGIENHYEVYDIKNPSPSKDEGRKDFLSRCMGDNEAQSSFPRTDQRYAFCNSQWARRNKNITDT